MGIMNDTLRREGRAKRDEELHSDGAGADHGTGAESQMITYRFSNKSLLRNRFRM
jgi:hypothetical protein